MNHGGLSARRSVVALHILDSPLSLLHFEFVRFNGSMVEREQFRPSG
jgi:hypothetical protein